MPKARNTGGGGDFPICPEGLFNALCVDVVDLGLQDYSYQGQPKGKRKEVRFVFQVDARDDEDEPMREEGGDRDGRMFEVWAKFTNSLASTSRLLPFIEQWTGKTIPQEVRDDGFELDNLIGRYGQVTIVHNKASNGKTYANIKGIMPLARGAEKFEPDEYVRTHLRPGYDPPEGSDLWEEAQARKRQPSKGRGRTKQVEEEELPFDEDEDDLPF